VWQTVCMCIQQQVSVGYVWKYIMEAGQLLQSAPIMQKPLLAAALPRVLTAEQAPAGWDCLMGASGIAATSISMGMLNQQVALINQATSPVDYIYLRKHSGQHQLQKPGRCRSLRSSCRPFVQGPTRR
jgi:hypothetical protein